MKTQTARWSQKRCYVVAGWRDPPLTDFSSPGLISHPKLQPYTAPYTFYCTLGSLDWVLVYQTVPKVSLRKSSPVSLVFVPPSSELFILTLAILDCVYMIIHQNINQK